MLTELLILLPLAILTYYRVIAWPWTLIIIAIAYWIPKMIFIRLLNYFYPDIITHKRTANQINPMQGEMKIALTFDDIPYPDTVGLVKNSLDFLSYNGIENLNKIVDLLDYYNMKGTFFVISDYIANDLKGQAKQRLIQMVKNGHQLGNHGKRNTMHYLLNNRTLIHEIESCDVIIKDIYKEAGQRLPDYMVYRPGCGLFHSAMIKECKRIGYWLTLGSVYPNDPMIQIPSINYYYLKYHIEENDIVILHDRQSTPRTLGMLLEYMVENNYKSVTVNDLCIE